MIIHHIIGAEIIEVIRVRLTAGNGLDEDEPLRPAFQYYSKAGELLAQSDPYAKSGQGSPQETHHD